MANSWERTRPACSFFSFINRAANKEHAGRVRSQAVLADHYINRR
jgi:hypothetical protein